MSKKREDYSEGLESEFRRLERAHKRVVNDFNPDATSKSAEEKLDSAFDFLKICFHLREKIKNDEKISESVKDRLPDFIDRGLKPDDKRICLPICKDVANLQKHGRLDPKYRPNDSNTNIEVSGPALFLVPHKDLALAESLGQKIHLKREDSIHMGRVVVLYKKHAYEISGVVNCCMYHWKDFFEVNDLLMPRMTAS